MTRFSVTQSSVTSPLVEHRSTRKRRTERRKSWSKEKRRAVIKNTGNHTETINPGVLLLEQIFLPDKVVKDPNFDVKKSATCDMEKVLLREPSVCSNFACDVKKTPLLRDKHVGNAFRSITSEKKPITNFTDVSSFSNGDCFNEGHHLEKHFIANGKMDVGDGVKFIERRECNDKEQNLRLLSNSENSSEESSQTSDGKEFHNINDIVNTETNSAKGNQLLEFGNGENSYTDRDNIKIKTNKDFSWTRKQRQRDSQISSPDLENGLLPKHYEKARLSTTNIVSNKRCRRPPQSYSPSNQHTTVKNCTITKRKHLFKDMDDEVNIEFSNNLKTKEKNISILPNERVSKLKLDFKNVKTTPKRSLVKPRHENSDGLVDKKNVDKQLKLKEKTQKIVYVLGLRQSSNGERQFLVQFENGTSNWLDNEKAYEQLNINLPVVGKYFNRNEQDISILQRLTSQWHCQNTKIFGCNNDVIQTSGLSSKNVTICDEELNTQRNPTPSTKPYQTDKENDEIASLKTKELQITNCDNYIHITIRHIDRRAKRINPNTCRELIERLECYANDNDITSVVVSGCEDYFCSPKDLENILKSKSNLISTMQNYDESIDVLRYLIQTIKLFPKPILATVKRPGHGLASLVLSMFDLVFDENGKEQKKDQKEITNLPCLFPKLMGLTSRSESKLMGENTKTYLQKQVDLVKDTFKGTLFSSNLDSTLEQLQSNLLLSPERYGRGNRFIEKSNRSMLNTEFDESPEISSLQLEIEKEKELSRLCMGELSTFWKDLIVSSNS